MHLEVTLNPEAYPLRLLNPVVVKNQRKMYELDDWFYIYPVTYRNRSHQGLVGNAYRKPIPKEAQIYVNVNKEESPAPNRKSYYEAMIDYQDDKLQLVHPDTPVEIQRFIEDFHVTESLMFENRPRWGVICVHPKGLQPMKPGQRSQIIKQTLIYER